MGVISRSSDIIMTIMKDQNIEAKGKQQSDGGSGDAQASSRPPAWESVITNLNIVIAVSA